MAAEELSKPSRVGDLSRDYGIPQYHVRNWVRRLGALPEISGMGKGYHRDLTPRQVAILVLTDYLSSSFLVSAAVQIATDLVDAQPDDQGISTAHVTGIVSVSCDISAVLAGRRTKAAA